MAGKIHDEQLKVDIVINGNKAQKELGNLQQKERELLKVQKDLRKEAAKLVAAGKKESEAFKNLTNEIKENKKSLDANKEEQISLRKQIGITSLTTTQLRREQKRLKAIMGKFSPNTPQWKQYNKELQKVENQLEKVKHEMKGTNSIIGRLNRNFSSFSGILAAVGFYQAVDKVKKLVTANADLAESQTDVQKTTSLTDQGIKKLTRRLKNLKTRSAVKELLDIAQAAGRLGKRGVDDIGKFVKAGDKINVALGDDLIGTTEENIRVIGKIADNYEIASNEGVEFAESMEMVGSAINEVSAAGSTQADFLVDYLKRLAGVSKQAKISAEDQIGYAAVLDEAGQSVEVSGTTMSKVMFNMFSDTKTYAEIAGVGVNDFTKMMNKDANAAFLLFLKGLNGNEAGLQKMAEKMKQLGIKGARSIGVLTTLASATDKIQKKQTLANKALKANISLTNEFNNKNENLPALLERISNWFHNIFTGGWIGESLKGIVLWFAKLLGVVDDTDGSVGRFRATLAFLVKLFLIVVTALVSYKGALQLIELWTNRSTLALKLNTMAAKANAAVSTFGKGALLLLKAAFFAVTGQTQKATAAMRLFGIVTKLSPLGLLIGAISAGVVAYALFADKIEDVTVAQKVLNSAKNTALIKMAEEKAQLDRLVAIAKDETRSKEERYAAIKKLNEISPKYLGGLTLENINTKEGVKLQNQYIESLNRKAMAQALHEKRVELYKKIAEEEGKSISENVKWYHKLWNSLKTGGQMHGYMANNMKTGLAIRDENITKIKEEIEAVNELEKKYTKEVLGNNNEPNNPTKPILPNNNNKKLSKADQNIIDSRKRLKELLEQLQEDQDFKDLLSGQVSREEEEDAASLDAYNKEIERIISQGLEKEEMLAELERAKNERLKAINDEWDENRVIEEEEKEIYAKEKEFEKLEEQAHGDAELLKNLEDLKQASIQRVIDKWAKYRRKQATKEQNKFLKNDGKFKKELIKAEQALQQAKSEALSQGIIALKGFAKEGTATYKALFLAEKVLAGLKIVTKNQEESAGYYAAYSGIPGGPLIASTLAAASKIRMFTSLGVLAAQTVQGFEDGLYPVTRNDGKKFNAKLGTTQTGLVSGPTLMDGNYLAGERSTSKNPEMIIDDVTFSKLDPRVPEYIMAVHNGTIPGYENGKYESNTSNDKQIVFDEENLTNKNFENSTVVIDLLTRIAEASEKGNILVIGYEEAEKIKDLQSELESSKQNGKLGA